MAISRSHLQGDNTTLALQIAAMGEQINVRARENGDLRTQVEWLEEANTLNTEQIKGLKTEVKTLKKKVKTLNNEIKTLNKEIKTLKKEVNTLEDRYAKRAEEMQNALQKFELLVSTLHQNGFPVIVKKQE